MMNKTSLYLGTLMLLAAGILAKVRSMVQVHVPEGYQDESGFHTGVKKAEKETNWPPVW